MSSIRIDVPTDAAIEHIAANMRVADIAEIWALSRLSPKAALDVSVSLTTYPCVAYDDDEPIAAFGVRGSILGDLGSPWLLGTDRIRKNVRPLIEMTGEFLSHYLSIYRKLENEVHAENRDAVRYLKAVGFEMADPYKTRTGALARRFWMERDDV